MDKRRELVRTHFCIQNFADFERRNPQFIHSFRHHIFAAGHARRSRCALRMAARAFWSVWISLRMDPLCAASAPTTCNSPQPIPEWCPSIPIYPILPHNMECRELAAFPRGLVMPTSVVCASIPNNSLVMPVVVDMFSRRVQRGPLTSDGAKLDRTDRSYISICPPVSLRHGP